MGKKKERNVRFSGNYLLKLEAQKRQLWVRVTSSFAQEILFSVYTQVRCHKGTHMLTCNDILFLKHAMDI